ncbi:unnamed protein product [Chrysodeixis includens]|uniref:Serpin domain-containing protein n=1 Tax=Chrysodeixis includens TaxID=689277 RepID=A0A9P0FWP6_CHRIL|nr:unnamed protein product [Chrysodeixis includens]
MKLFICLFALVAAAMADANADLLKAGNDQFTAKMLKEVATANKGKSVVLSAFSVLSPLAQLALASEGPSHDEILNAIGLPNDDVTKSVFKDVSNQLRSVKGVELKLANRLYVKKSGEVDDEFNTMSKDVFNSDSKTVDFTQASAAAGEINAWVEENTNNRIKDLVDPQSLNPPPDVILVNALYFKGKWSKPFAAEDTQNLTFYGIDKTIQIPTMYKNEKLNYAESKELDAQLVEVPYAGGETSLLIVLPNKVDGITALVEKLKDPSALNKAVSVMESDSVNLYLPKMKIETTTDLGDILPKVGVQKLFTSQAKLTKLLKGQELMITKAVQKAFIEVNEQGSEAAAANAFSIEYLSAIVEQKTVKFQADHPFVFFLKGNDNILFNGVFQS